MSTTASEQSAVLWFELADESDDGERVNLWLSTESDEHEPVLIASQVPRQLAEYHRVALANQIKALREAEADPRRLGLNGVHLKR